MKRLLGAIAAAMLLGAGCAHERGNQIQTDVPASPQASVDTRAQGQLGGAGGAGTAGGLDCEVISGGSASTSAVGGAGSQSDQSAIGGSASDMDASTQDDMGRGYSDLGVPDQGAIGGSASSDLGASEQSGISGSASGQDVADQSGIGGSASGQDVADQSGIGGSASEAGAVDDTSIGGADTDQRLGYRR
jgi:hypothetical protein